MLIIHVSIVTNVSMTMMVYTKNTHNVFLKTKNTWVNCIKTRIKREIKKDTAAEKTENKSNKKTEIVDEKPAKKEKEVVKTENDLIQELMKPGDNLYKILKALEKNKDSKLDKKQLLKKIVVNKDGKLAINL